MSELLTPDDELELLKIETDREAARVLPPPEPKESMFFLIAFFVAMFGMTGFAMLADSRGAEVKSLRFQLQLQQHQVGFVCIEEADGWEVCKTRKAWLDLARGCIAVVHEPGTYRYHIESEKLTTMEGQ